VQQVLCQAKPCWQRCHSVSKNGWHVGGGQLLLDGPPLQEGGLLQPSQWLYTLEPVPGVQR
jgi:hypothetical protein